MFKSDNPDYVNPSCSVILNALNAPYGYIAPGKDSFFAKRHTR